MFNNSFTSRHEAHENKVEKTYLRLNCRKVFFIKVGKEVKNEYIAHSIKK